MEMMDAEAACKYEPGSAWEPLLDYWRSWLFRIQHLSTSHHVTALQRRRTSGSWHFHWPSWSSSTANCARPLGSTAYLDGVRGVACFFVYFNHVWSLYAMDALWPHLFDTPILSVILAGPAAVSVFLIVSGFAISYKPIRQARSRDLTGMSDTLASSVFRRWPRLFLPVIAIVLIQATLAQLNLDRNGFGWQPPNRPQETVWKQIVYLYLSLCNFLNPMRAVWAHHHPQEIRTGYDEVPWTIPIEYMGSMIVFVTILATSRMTPKARMLGVAILAGFCYFYMYWDIMLFLCGLLFAESHCIRHHSPWPRTNGDFRELSQGEVPSIDASQKPTPSISSRIFWVFNFVGAMYLLSVPRSHENPYPWGFGFLYNLTASSWVQAGLDMRFWTIPGAIWLMASLEFGPMLQVLFTNRVAQYLGKVSYMLYLVHITVTRMFGWVLWNWVFVGLNIYFRCILSFGLSTVVVLAVAHAGTVYIDGPVVRLNRWAWEKLCMKKETHVTLRAM